MMITALLLLQVVFLDICLSGDNAVVIAMAAAGLPKVQQKIAIAAGMAMAILMRIGFSFGAMWLLGNPWFKFVGGALLLWICWNMYCDIIGDEDAPDESQHHKSFFVAMLQIMIADLSMSLDNIMAIAATAQGHPVIMAIGLILSIGFMGVASTLILKLMERFTWIKWAGLALVLMVALRLLWEFAKGFIT